EDWRLFILVDGNDELAVFHAGQVLDGTGNTNSDVKLRRYDLAGLPYLHIVGNEAGIDGSTRCANRRAQLVGQRVQQLEIVAILHAATTGDDNARCGEFGAIA